MTAAAAHKAPLPEQIDYTVMSNDPSDEPKGGCGSVEDADAASRAKADKATEIGLDT